MKSKGKDRGVVDKPVRRWRQGQRDDPFWLCLAFAANGPGGPAESAVPCCCGVAEPCAFAAYWLFWLGRAIGLRVRRHCLWGCPLGPWSFCRFPTSSLVSVCECWRWEVGFFGLRLTCLGFSAWFADGNHQGGFEGALFRIARWYRHITLALLVHALLAVTRCHCAGGDVPRRTRPTDPTRGQTAAMPAAVATSWESYPDHWMVVVETATSGSGPCGVITRNAFRDLHRERDCNIRSKYLS